MSTNIRSKRFLVSTVANKAGVSKTETQAILDALTEVVEETLKSGGEVTLAGVKIFTKVRSAIDARETVHPRTGERISYPRTPAKRVVKAKPLPAFKSKIDKVLD